MPQVSLVTEFCDSKDSADSNSSNVSGDIYDRNDIYLSVAQSKQFKPENPVVFVRVTFFTFVFG